MDYPVQVDRIAEDDAQVVIADEGHACQQEWSFRDSAMHSVGIYYSSPC